MLQITKIMINVCEEIDLSVYGEQYWCKTREGTLTCYNNMIQTCTFSIYPKLLSNLNQNHSNVHTFSQKTKNINVFYKNLNWVQHNVYSLGIIYHI